METQLQNLTKTTIGLYEPSKYRTLFGLVQRYSPSGQESQAVTWMMERMNALGYDKTFIDDAGNAIGIKGSGKKAIVLLGHIDTVPGEIPVRIENDYTGTNAPIIYGRGSVDAKGSLAAFIDAVSLVKPEKDYRLIVIGAVDEERDSVGARHIVKKFFPSYAIIGEPSHWDKITLGYKGSAWATVKTYQTMQHSASGEENACELAVNIWNKVKNWTVQFNQEHQRIFNQITPILGKMRSGVNSFKNWASIDIGVRLPTSLHPDAWYSQLQELANEAEVKPISYAIPAYKGEKNSPLVRAFLRSIRSSNGGPSFSVKSGTSDMNIVAPAWDCPIVAYGPGDSTLDHTPNEHISLQEYSIAVHVLEKVLNILMRND
jgi:LysW-gamma-L-lysine carboxypeptidase